MTKVYFETFGCSANVADTEQMAGLLEAAPFTVTKNEEEADVIILNTCTVKGPTESAIMRRLQELKDGYKIVILAGCLTQADRKAFKNYPTIGTNQIHKVVEIVEEALNDNIVRELSMQDMPPLNLPVIRKNPIIEIIPISRGCLGQCTFCKTKFARGSLVSYPIEDIVKRSKKAVREEVKEIWLTSQDTGCYGFDIGTSLPKLLNELVKVEGDFKIRVGMMNPDHLIKIQDELIESFKHEKIFKFLHLPVQAGNDTVLENMKRLYTARDYELQVQAFRKAIPKINIMTDIIVGFPSENEDQFYQTISVVRKTSPDSINISRFWARPNTPAAKMKNKVNGAEIKRRSKVLTDIFHNISRLQNERWLGWSGEILIDEIGKREGQFIGRNDSYKQIIVQGDYKIGQTVNVKVVKTDTFALIGKDLNASNLHKIPKVLKLKVI